MAEAPKKNSLVRAAREALSQGNHAEAVRCCKHALKQDRTNYDAFVVLGKSLFASKQLEQAEISYKRAIEINSSDTRAWQGLVELHEANRNYSKVVEACNYLVQAFQSKGDLAHLAEYARRLAKAYMILDDPQSSLKAWNLILENKSMSEGLHFEALCGFVDSKAILMDSWIQENCKVYLSQDTLLDADSAKQLTETSWASSQDSTELEKGLWDILKHTPGSEKYETMLLHLLVWRMRANFLIKGEERHQLCLKILHLCLSVLSWHASNLATALLLAFCEEDTVDDIFKEVYKSESVQGRLNRLHFIGKRLAHAYPDRPLMMAILVFFMHHSPSCSVSSGQKRSLCENALRMDENNIIGWQVLAELRASEGSHSSAFECVRRGLQIVKQFRNLYGLTLQCAELRLQLVSGDLFLKLGSKVEASQVFQNIIKVAEERHDLEAHKVLTLAKEGQVRLYLAEGCAQEASTSLVTLLSLDKFNSWALSEQGWLAYNDKDYEQAITLLQQAIDLKPTNAEYHYRLGMVYWDSSDQKEKALSHLLKSARLDSSQSNVFRTLGHCYKTLPGGLKRAIKCYQKAISINCEDGEAGEALCDILDKDGQESLEFCSCREACERSPRAFWAFRRLGYIQLKRKDWSDAAKNLQHAARGYQTCAHVWEALGLAYQQLGMLTAALKAYSRVLTTNEDSSLYALQQSGNVLLTLGLNRKAVTMFQAALVKAPDHPAGMCGLASAFLGQARECRSMGSVQGSAVLLQEASAVASSCLTKHGNFGTLWKLLGDIEIYYARNLPWGITFGLFDGDSGNTLKCAHGKKSLPADFGLSLTAWKDQRLQAALKAKRAYQHGMHLQPHKGNLYADLCVCLDFIGLVEENDEQSSKRSVTVEAVACCGLALEGSHADLWTSLGVVAKSYGVQQHAFIQALRFDGNHALAWAELGRLYQKLGEHKLAKEAFTHARSADPTLGLTWAAMANMQDSNRTEEIQEAFASILYASQLTPVANFQLGLAKISAAVHQLDSEQVYAAVEQAVLQAPHRPEVHNFKGLVYELRGKFKHAVAAFRMAQAALEFHPVDLQPSSLDVQKNAASTNLARVLCKAGDAQAAIEEYETLARLGQLEDSSALRGYATALWQTGQKKLAVSIAKVAVKKSDGKLEVYATMQLLAKLIYNVSGPAAALEDMRIATVNVFTEPALAITAFAIAAAAGQSNFLLQKTVKWAVLFNHDKAGEFASLVAASMQLSQDPEGKIHHASPLLLFQRTLHMHPQSLSIRTKLMQLLLERSNGLEINVAARCCFKVHITRGEKTGNLSSVCQMLSAAVIACSVCGNIKPQFSFSSCKSHGDSDSNSTRALQRWMHLEPWNIMSQYHLMLCLTQQAREEKFPANLSRVILRMVAIILAKMPLADDTSDETQQYMHLQILLCKSEAALHDRNHEVAVESATNAMRLKLGQNLLALPRLQLLRCYVAEGNPILADAELQKVGNLTAVDISTLLCALEMTCKLGKEKDPASALRHLELATYEGSYEHILKALTEWKKAELYIWTGELPLAETAALNAANLWPEADCLQLFHGAICMELAKSGSGSVNLSYACRRLMKVASESGNKLPIGGLLVAQAQAEKAGLPGWERLVRQEWMIWPEEYKPAELCFQLGILGKMSKGSNASAPGNPDLVQNPRAWFKKAVHINPSCGRYWSMLRQGEASDPAQ